MARIYMIRHGKAAAGWDADPDPGLDATGQAQAEAVAEEIAARVGHSLPIFTSPLKRCQETAAPLATLWESRAVIEPRVSESPSPITDLEERTVWLRRVMGGTWEALYNDPQSVLDFRAWSAEVTKTLLEQQRDVVIFSHFIALNVAYCAATGSDKVVSFRPDNASVTILYTDGEKLALVEKGREADTLVNPGKK